MAGNNQGAKVKWSWGNGTGEGEIQKIYSPKVTRTIKGTRVTREATKTRQRAWNLTRDLVWRRA